MSDDGSPPLPDASSLIEAFKLFNQTSQELTEAYGTLQQEVQRLSAELAEANVRLRAELQAKEQMRERLALLLEMLPGAVLVVDHAALIVEMNPEAIRLLGADLRGSDWQTLQPRPMSGSGEEWLLLRGPDRDQPVQVTLAVSALPGEGGQVILLQDVTAARAREEAAQRRERLAAMGETMAGLAHQLRTPLATALLSVSHLQFERGPEHFARQQQRSLERLQHLDATIDAMLRFLRGAEQESGSVALIAILHALQREWDPHFRQKNVTLEIGVARDDWFLTGTLAAWVSVLANVLHNALLFSNPGQAVSMRLEEVNRGILRLSIRDFGPGIAEADQERIFIPFYTTRRDGTGLGLAITRNFVVAMGGSIELEKVSPGTCLVLLLPLWQVAQPLPSGSMSQE
ncbi:sensor histidine kinase [Acidithiobacillus sulfurivorans]|uniref:histidine kinase n=1 Tax=Acidithiobacillus sulfurivorans TaxID=1958756 RepID=A0ABS5ZZ47_9PROT|nr:PAS domain-containing sensor histidine kinase [Acidithiobacillus sulfurivorans]MBU2760484.1 PAS domain-containing protein [Acidithiobacillus sulfurivorans]